MKEKDEKGGSFAKRRGWVGYRPITSTNNIP